MKKIKLHCLVCLLIVLLTACQAKKHGNTGYRPAPVATFDASPPYLENNFIETISVSHAPMRITRHVIEDSQGHIWIASWDGVFRFNGIDFQNVTKEVSNARFFSIIEDRKNNFWMASVGSGVFYYDGQSFQNYNTTNGLINDRVTNIYEDQAGHIWFGTEGGISIFDGSTFRHLTMADGLSDNRVNSITEDANGKYWIGTYGQAVIYDPTFATFTPIINTDGKFFENIRQIIKSSNGEMWLGGSHGLWRYDYQQFIQYSDAFTGYVFEDTSGNILTSSNEQSAGTWVLNSFKDNPYYPKQLVKVKGMIFGVVKDANGQIWYGTLNGLNSYSDGMVYHYVVNQESVQ